MTRSGEVHLSQDGGEETSGQVFENTTIRTLQQQLLLHQGELIKGFVLRIYEFVLKLYWQDLLYVF